MANMYKSSSRTRSKHYAVRACLLGEASSGKSSFFYRVKYNAFRDSPEEQDKTHTTSGGPNSRTRFYDSYNTVRRPDRATKINLTLMDTGSRERYQSLTAQYYNRANVIILVCSLDSEHTLTCLTKWHAEAQYYIDGSNIVYAVVGTKSDLPETEREVTIDLLHNFASHLGIPLDCVFEVSAVTGEGVEDLISHVCNKVVGQFSKNSFGASEGTRLLNGSSHRENGPGSFPQTSHTPQSLPRVQLDYKESKEGCYCCTLM